VVKVEGSRDLVRRAVSVLLLLACLCLAACSSNAAQGNPEVVTPDGQPSVAPAEAATEIPPAATPTPVPSPTATATAVPTATPTREPFVVMLDPGHGGFDLGARRFDENGKMVYHESTINLELALLTRDELLARGFQVRMTRETDTTVNVDQVDTSGDGVLEYTQDEMHARIDVVNASDADLLLSIHHNAWADANGVSYPEVGGIQTYYCADRPWGAENRRFALLVHQYLTDAMVAYGYHPEDRGVLDDFEPDPSDSRGKHLMILGPVSARIRRETHIPGVLSEPVFITHAEEGLLLQDPAFLHALAVGYAEAIEAFVDGVVPPEPEETSP
jgi:N-acetylmuramoyl-L-alanine amidase